MTSNPDWHSQVGFRPRRDYAPEYAGELKKLAGNIHDQNPARRRAARQISRDLLQLMTRANDGTVRSGKDHQETEWEYPVGDGRDAVGELKYPTGDRTDIDGWQYRIYFGTPDEVQDLLVYLLAGRKRTSKLDALWYVVQNNHIGDAKDRMSRWRTDWSIRQRDF